MKRVKTDLSEADIGMTVFGSTAWIFTVVDMEDGNLIFSEDPVEFSDDVIELMDNIVAAVVRVAGIETDAEFVVVNDAIVDPCQLLKSPSDFRTPFRPWFPARYSSLCRQSALRSIL